MRPRYVLAVLLVTSEPIGVRDAAASRTIGATECPPGIHVVGKVNGGANPDPFGFNSITVRDATNAPIPDVLVTLDFSGCCDIALCREQPGIDCTGSRVSGRTNASGTFTFTIIGSARDPGNIEPCEPPGECVYDGCGGNAVIVTADPGDGPVTLCQLTAACLDLNGAAGGSSGTTGSDVSNLKNLFGAVSLGQPHQGRGDMNFDGIVSGADVSFLIHHFGRLGLIGAIGCPPAGGSTFCGVACP